MVGIPGFSKRLFRALSNEKINVILITKALLNILSVLGSMLHFRKAKMRLIRRFPMRLLCRK